MSTDRGGPYPLPPIRQQFGHSLNHHSPPAPAPAPSQAPPIPPAPVHMSPAAHPVLPGVPGELVGNDGSKSYQLIVGQQPNRARMCGFGDKDRRPITPPPCVQVIVRDLKTGKAYETSELSYQHYILHVDLWNEDGTKEVSMVKHNAHTAQASTGTLMSFEETLAPNLRLFTYPQQEGGASHGQAPAGYPQTPPAYPTTSPTATQSYGYPTPVHRNSLSSSQPHDSLSQFTGVPASRNSPARMSLSQPHTACTRNLVGNGSMSAQRLIGCDDKAGMWFVLQDLSVRTEGVFRLRFTFIDALRKGSTNPAGISDPKLLNKTVCPILAYKFSEPFQVYSAKKFPGVCESTELSRKFASQGVKIPIRKDGEGKDGKGKKRRRGDDDDDGDSDGFDD